MICLLPRSACLLLLLLPFACAAQTDASSVASLNSDLAIAAHAFRAGKFADAEADYRAILKTSPELTAAQVGLVRSMLRLQKVDESFEAVNGYLAAQPNSADLLAARGDVLFRRAEMNDAQNSYLAALKIDPRQVRAYLGLARLYASFSLYRKAYDELQRAHSIAPEDLDVRRLWLLMLPRKERTIALEQYLASDHPDDADETQAMREYLELLQALADKPQHSCKLIGKMEQTQTHLAILRDEDGHRLQGVGLPVKVNDYQAHLLLDTGAGGLILSRKVAEKAGLAPISAEHHTGLGDKGLQSGYKAIADHIQIGELEFQDCVVSVSNKAIVGEGDGLIGTDVFSSYLVDIDLPASQLRLSPLPKRPEDAFAPRSLNSVGEEQSNVERNEISLATKSKDQQASPAVAQQTTSQPPRDRYIAPEMANWTKVFHFGHCMLVPTWVNDSHNVMLFGLDTGAFANVLSLRAARQLGKVSSDHRLWVRGISGDVNKVYSSRATLRFGNLHQPDQDVVTLDLSSLSRATGTEVSGLLGYDMLRILEVKIDYRDGLVDFEYDPKRIHHILRSPQR